MKLTVEEQHAVRIKRGKNICIKCRAIDPDLQKPCPKSGVPRESEPAGAP